MASAETAARARRAPRGCRCPRRSKLMVARSSCDFDCCSLATGGTAAGQLAPGPHHGIVVLGDDPLLEGDDRVVGDVDVLGADVRAALGDVAVAESRLVLDHLPAVVRVERMHLELGQPHEEARAREHRLVLWVIAYSVAHVLAHEALDALSELLAAVDVLLEHPARAVRLLRPWLERADGPGLLVVERHVGDEVATHRERLHRRDRDRLPRREGVHAGHAHEARPPIDLGAARAALSRLAVPAAREI